MFSSTSPTADKPCPALARHTNTVSIPTLTMQSCRLTTAGVANPGPGVARPLAECQYTPAGDIGAQVKELPDLSLH